MGEATKKAAKFAAAVQQPAAGPERSLAHVVGFAAFGDRIAWWHLYSGRFQRIHDHGCPESLLHLAP